MRFLYFLAPALVLLAGCGSSSSPTKSAQKPTLGPRVATVPVTSPVPVRTSGSVAAVPHATLKGGRLPTPQQVIMPTPTAFPATMYKSVIYGTVTDAKTGSPLAGAIIKVGVTGKHVMVTNSFGKYRLSFPSGPAVPVTVTIQGYASPPAMGTLPAGKTYRLDFKLAPEKKGTSIIPPPPIVFGHP